MQGKQDRALKWALYFAMEALDSLPAYMVDAHARLAEELGVDRSTEQPVELRLLRAVQ